MKTTSTPLLTLASGFLLAATVACRSATPPASLAALDGGAAPPPAACKPGSARCPQSLYSRQGRVIASLAVDDQSVYWSERHDKGISLFQAPKVGAGAVTELGWYYGGDLSAQAIVADGKDVFWARKANLARVPRGGGETASLPFEDGQPGDEWVASLLVDTDSVWVVQFGCGKVARFPKAGGAPQLHRVHELPPFRVGTNTGVFDDGRRILCGNGPEIYALEKASGAATRLVSDQYRVLALAEVSGDLYWINNRYGNEGERLMVLRAGQRTAEDLGHALATATVLHHDAALGRLYWIAGKGDDRPIVSYDLARGTLATLATARSVQGGNAQDERFLYWGAERDIMRVEK